MPELPEDPWEATITFRFVEFQELEDGFWGAIKHVTFRNGAKAYMIEILISPPDSIENSGFLGFALYQSVEEAREKLPDELSIARAHGLRSTIEGGQMGQPIYLRLDTTNSRGVAE